MRHGLFDGLPEGIVELSEFAEGPLEVPVSISLPAASWHDSAMTRFQALDVQESIHVPVARVWDLLTDWVAAPKWMPGVDSMEAEQLTSLGAVIDYRSGPHERQLVISELQDGRSITLSTGGGDISVLYSYELSEGSGQTTVRLMVSVSAAAELEEEVGELLAAIADSESGTLKALRIYAEAAP